MASTNAQRKPTRILVTLKDRTRGFWVEGGQNACSSLMLHYS